MDERLGIAGSAELVAARDQAGAQFLIIVDLAIEDDPHGTVLIRDGLVAGREIDNAQPAHADTAAAIDIHAFVVGTTMANLVAHGLDMGRLGGLIETHKTGNTAHRKPGRRGTPSNLASRTVSGEYHNLAQYAFSN